MNRWRGTALTLSSKVLALNHNCADAPGFAVGSALFDMLRDYFASRLALPAVEWPTSIARPNAKAYTVRVTGNFVMLDASRALGTSGPVAKVLALRVFCLAPDICIQPVICWLRRECVSLK